MSPWSTGFPKAAIIVLIGTLEVHPMLIINHLELVSYEHSAHHDRPDKLVKILLLYPRAITDSGSAE